MKSDKSTPNVPTLRFREFTNFWTSTTLASICTYRKTRRTASKRTYISTENILQNYQGIDRFNSDDNVSGDGFNSGDILMGNIRPYLKKVCFANFDGVCNADVLVFKSKSVNPKFLYFIIANDNFINYVMSSVKGSKMPRGDKGYIMQYPVSLPSNEEQIKIAHFLDLINKRIEVQNKIISKYESLIKGLCEYIITIANGHSIRLGEISTIYQPQTITQAELSENGAYPVFGANGIIGYYHQFNHAKAQIIITCRGSTCGTVNMSAPNSWITGNSMVINVDGYEGIVDKQYLFYYLKTISFKSMISGSGQPQIVRKPLVDLLISLPELNIQVKYRSIIDTIDKKLVKEKDMLCRLLDLKAYLLSNLFI